MTKKDYYMRVMKDSLIFTFIGLLSMTTAAALAPNPGNIILIRMLRAELYVSYAASILTFRIGFTIASISLAVGLIFTILYK